MLRLPVHKRVTILVGEFGSGKTELAVHYSLALAERGLKTALIDFDIAKPCFRVREKRDWLESRGIQVAAPEPRLASSGLPLLPPDVQRLLSDDSFQVVMDVGGGDSAVALGQLRPQLEQAGYDALLVVNTLRPFTADCDGIVNSLRRIEQVSRLKLTGLLANSNLAAQTTVAHVEAGLTVVRQAAEYLQLPVRAVTAPVWLAGRIKTAAPLLWLEPCTCYPWMEQAAFDCPR
ncbi:MAG: division plane positioning ATPase MipZ [Sporomusaceae bacterium]|nr:division plane positioning ATPase MipZ [Sporomusaceae bacterium]